MSSAEKPSRSSCTSLLTINFVRVQTDPGRMRSLPARVQEPQSLVHALDRSYYPKLYLQSVVMGRGSGVDPTGNFLGGTEGLGPDRANWAAGLMVTFPVFDIFSIKSKKAVEAANERAEKARYDQTVQDLTGQLGKAQASLEGARKVAENTPVELEAAHSTETQVRAR